MSRLNDLKEQLQDRLKEIWLKVQESSAFISLKEKYDNMKPSSQRLLRMGAIFGSIGFMLWSMWGMFAESSVKLAEFQEYQNAIKDIIKLKRNIALAPRIASPPSPAILEQRVHSILESFYLDPKQIEDVSTRDLDPSALIQPPGKSKGPDSVEQKGVWLSLRSLNLTQVADIGFRLQTIHTAVKLIGLDMKASEENENYYDVMYTIVGFYPPPINNENDTDDSKNDG